MDMDKELKKAIEKVKGRLWSWNYRVKDVTKIPGMKYHLIVNGAHRVYVRTAKSPEKIEIKADGSPVYEDECDVVACVEGKAVVYMKSGDVKTSTTRAYEVMDLHN